MDIENKLKTKLRIDFNNKLRPLIIKNYCECCGSGDNLELHHKELFSLLFDKAISDLCIDINNMNDKQLEILRTYMLGLQLKCDYITVCENCHDKVHSENTTLEDYKKLRRELKKQKVIEEKVIKLETYLKMNIGNVMLTKDDREELIEKIGVKNKDGKLLKGINTLNGYLEEVNLPYRIIQLNRVTKTIDGKKKNFKSPWKLISLDEEE